MTPAYTMTAFERSSLTGTLGAIGVRALDSILSRIREGEKPKRADTLKFARALHRNQIVDFSDWPEFQAPQPVKDELCITQGTIGRLKLNTGCYTWQEVLVLATRELRRTGEARAVRMLLRTGRVTVRQYLRERFGIESGPRQYWHRENWTPDRADLQDFLWALRRA